MQPERSSHACSFRAHCCSPDELLPSYLFGNGMVLQSSGSRGAVIQGFAPANAAVHLLDDSAFHPQGQYASRADAKGRWHIVLRPYECCAAADPNRFNLTLRATNRSDGSRLGTFVATDCAFGTVLLCFCAFALLCFYAYALTSLSHTQHLASRVRGPSHAQVCSLRRAR